MEKLERGIYNGITNAYKRTESELNLKKLERDYLHIINECKYAFESRRYINRIYRVDAVRIIKSFPVQFTINKMKLSKWEIDIETRRDVIKALGAITDYLQETLALLDEYICSNVERDFWLFKMYSREELTKFYSFQRCLNDDGSSYDHKLSECMKKCGINSAGRDNVNWIINLWGNLPEDDFIKSLDKYAIDNIDHLKKIMNYHYSPANYIYTDEKMKF
jgi:hypothetical protein